MIALTPAIDSLPSLPTFSNLDIERQVFTHRSFHSRPSHTAEDSEGDPSPDNEALEHLGDAILTMCTTALIRELYPRLRPGAATKVRAQIVSNDNLASIGRAYDFGSRLIAHPSQKLVLKDTPGIIADTVEAYIGGLQVDQPLDPIMSPTPSIQSWLTSLLTPYVHAAYQQEVASYAAQPTVASPNIGIGYTALLNQTIAQRNWEIEYIERKVDGLPQNALMWDAQVNVNGENMGVARAPNKKMAKNLAAGKALEVMGLIPLLTTPAVTLGRMDVDVHGLGGTVQAVPA